MDRKKCRKAGVQVMCSCILVGEVATSRPRRHPYACDWRWIAAVALFVGGNAGHSLAFEVTCAIVPASDSEEDLTPLSDFLDVALSRSGDLAVLSRTEMERLLAERSISLEHGRSSPGDYQAMGALLRADLLVFLYGRRVEKKGVLLEFAVVETKHGIRLLAEDFAWQGHAFSMAETLSERVFAAKERIAVPIKYLFAVPAFECTDLLFAPAAQGRAYAEMARRTIEKVDATAVVDLEYASDLAAELSLSNGSDRIERAMPYYIIGTYHHTGSGDERRVAMELTLRHGPTVVRKEAIPPLSLDAAGRAVTSVVERMLVEATDAKPKASDSTHNQREAALLAKRARELASFNDWVRAIDLAESALLLDPTRTRLHFLIARWCERFVRIDGRKLCQNLKNAPAPTTTRPHEFFLGPERKRRYALSALDHLRRYAVNEPLDQNLANTIYVLFSSTGILNYDWQEDTCDFRKRQRFVIKEKLDVFLRVLAENESRMHEYREGFILSNLASAGAQIVKRWSPYSTDERLDVLHSVLLGFSHFKYGYEAQCRLLLESFTLKLGKERELALSRCVTRLADAEDPRSKLTVAIVRTILDIGDIAEGEAARATIDDLLRMAYRGEEVADLPSFSIDVLLQRRLRALGKGRPHVVQSNFCSEQEGVLTAIELKTTNGSRRPSFRSIATWGGFFPCGDGLDLVHAEKRLFAMRQPGILDPIPPPKGEEWRLIGSVASDGRYIWIADPTLRNPIVVLDRDTLAIVASFGLDQGLPPIESRGDRGGAKIAAIAPGQACVVGAFGRTWIATLTFDPNRPNGSSEHVDVFHEARQEWFSNKNGVRQISESLGRAFYPQFAEVVETGQPKRRLVLIGRHASAGVMSELEDVIVADPANRTVRVLPVDWPARSYAIPDHQRLIRIFREYHGEHLRYLQVLQSPDFSQTQSVQLDPPAFPRGGFGEFVVDGDTIYLIQDHELTTIDLVERKIVRHCGLTKKQSRFGARLARSSQYGLILYSNAGTWRVQLPKSNLKPGP